MSEEPKSDVDFNTGTLIYVTPKNNNGFYILADININPDAVEIRASYSIKSF